jgi:hypothetical protein
MGRVAVGGQPARPRRRERQEASDVFGSENGNEAQRAQVYCCLSVGFRANCLNGGYPR